MENPCLNDPDEYPDEEVLRRALGKAKPAWDAFQHLIADWDPPLSGQWRYYRDGKSWLYKLTKKKQTVCWISVYPNAFRTTFYFPDRAEAFIQASPLAQAYIDQFVQGKRYGRIRGVTVQVQKKADLKAVETLLEIKDEVK